MSNELEVTRLGENLYRIQEDSTFMNVDAYLICGQKQAVVIDGLGITEGLYECIKEITDKPVSMIVAHGHPDHAGKGMQEFLEAGCEVFLSFADLELVKEHTEGTDISALKNMKESFDLGGITVKTMAMPGHTQGSVMLFWEKEKLLFTSDAIGSGSLWMQLPESSSLEEYLIKLKELENLFNQWPDIKIYPGHSWQISAFIGEEKDYLGREYVKELIELTEGIVNGSIVGDEKVINLDFVKGIAIRSVSGSYVTDYCYDVQKIQNTT